MSPEGKNVQRGELRLGTRTVGLGKARVASRSCGLLAAGWIAVFLFLFTVSSFAATADLRLGQTVSAARVTLGANVTFTVAVTNDGPDAATGVTLRAPISPRATFVSTVPSQGACTLVGRTISCDLGALDSNGVATVAMTLKTGAGTNESVATITAAETDPNLSNNVSTQSTVGILLQEYSNGEAILLPELDPGPASIYPLNISVAGLTSAVDKVTVTLRNVTHFWPDDLDILLVGPGNRVLLMSDCGLDNAMSDVTLVFDDDATASLPNSDPGITSGTYKPTNFDRLSDTFASPAPPEPYITNLSGFKGLNPNGTWSLYVMDDSPENLGYITDGWTLSLSLSDPLANVGLGAAGTPSSIIVGNTVRYNVAVTNFGPALSPTQARLELPPSFVFVGAIASRGSCSSGPGGVVCDFGNLQWGG